MRILVTLFVVMLSHFALFAQLDCVNATQISCGQTLTDNNLVGCVNTVTGGYCGSADNSYTGKEKIYKLVIPTTTQTVNISLTGLTADLDLFLLRSCTPGDCIANSATASNTAPEVVSATLAPGLYFIVVDGWGGAGCNYNLSVSCASSTGQPDCATATPIACGQTVTGNTSTGVNNTVGPYCSAYCNYTGKEKVYSLNVTTTSTVTINATGLTGDLDMFLLNACNRNSCMASSGYASNSNEQIIKVLTPGTYYIVLDGYAGAISPFQLSVSCVPLSGGIDCNTIISYNYSGSGNDLKFFFKFNGGFNTQFVGWKINNSIVATAPNVNITFPGAGTFQVCAEFINLATGLTQTCCKSACVSLPTTCESLIQYTYTNGRFVLALAGNPTNIANLVWRNDTDGVDLDPTNVPASCRTLLVTVRYLDLSTNCWVLCCRSIAFCAPTSCQDGIQSNYIAAGNKFKFTFNNPTATNLTWRFDNDGTVLPNGEFPLPANWTCADRTVTVYYYDTASQCWRVCCRKFNLCPPASCESAINYSFSATGNKYVFSLSTLGAAAPVWRFDEDGTVLTNGEFPIPANWVCKDRTVTATYFDPSSQTWRVCCRKIYICPPVNCETAVQYQYVANGNKFQFTLNVAGATNQTWKFDDDGTVLPNGMFVLPTGWVCKDRTVTVYYYDAAAASWKVCCRRITICPPVNCETAVQYQYVPAGNKFQFTLNVAGATNQTWKFDDDGTVLPNGMFVLPANWTCADRTVTVYYYDPSSQCWRVCCRRITICPPTNCETAIQYTFNANLNKFQFTLNVAGATGVTWKFDDDGTVLPNGGFTLPNGWNCANRTVTAYYYDPSSQCWRVCCRKVYICPPGNCETAVQYQYVAAGNKFVFTLNVPGATGVSWRFDNDGTVLPNGEFVLPTNWACQDRTVTVYYYDPSAAAWKVCCRKINICPPTNCETAIQYQYVAASNKFVFTLNVPGATGASWRFDNDGTVLPNGEFVIPANWTCGDRIVTAYYFDPSAQTWRVCCRRIYICPPTNCQAAITYAYNPGGNAVNFTFNGGTTLSNVSWQVEETGQQLGSNSNTSATLLVPVPCAERTVSIRYSENGIWYICCKKVYLCNPYDCSGNIQHSVSGNTLSLSISNIYTDVTWKNVSTGQSLGSGNTATYTLTNGSGNLSVCVTYKNPTTGVYQTCYKDISISCNTPVANFQFALAGSGVIFTNTSTGATSYTWSFNGGTPVAGSTTSSTNPTVVYASGTYNVCLTATNSCGSKTICKSVLMSNASDCVFQIAQNVCGGTGQEVLIPISVRKFNDVLAFNFTIRSADSSKVEIMGITNFNATIQSGNNSIVFKDHLRFFWSDPIGKSLPDSTVIFALRVKIKGSVNGSTALNFSDDPVKTEAYGSNSQLLALQLVPGSVCTATTASLSGKIETPEGNAPVAQTSVQISGAMTAQQTTGTDGLYALGNLTSGGNYVLKPQKNILPLNGINALDIVRLQRHLLQIDPITSPYKLIAADVNNDRVINALDVVVLQRLQLRILDTFPNNQSWRFVPKTYTFTTNNPLTENFPESMAFNPLSSNETAKDFYGIKIGDLNNTASSSDVVGDGNNPAGRSPLVADTVKMNLSPAYGLQGQTIAIPVKCRKFNGVLALEGSFGWDTLKLQYVGIGNFGLPGMSSTNFGIPLSVRGALTFVWTDGSSAGTTLPDGTLMFNILFKAIGNVGAVGAVNFTNNPLTLFAADAAEMPMTVQTQNSSITIIAPIAAVAAFTTLNCFGGSTATATVTAQGGTGSYKYQWSNGAITQNITGLSAGTYTCTITDILANITTTALVFIPNPTELLVSISSSQQGATSTATANVTGGTQPYMYLWTNGSTNATLTNMINGVYGVTVTDFKGCTARSSVTIVNMVGTDEISEGSVKIYPNPTTGLVKVEFQTMFSGRNLQWSITNLLGQNLLNGEFAPDVTAETLDLTKLPDGMYHLHIQSGLQHLTASVVLLRQ